MLYTYQNGDTCHMKTYANVGKTAILAHSLLLIIIEQKHRFCRLRGIENLAILRLARCLRIRPTPPQSANVCYLSAICLLISRLPMPHLCVASPMASLSLFEDPRNLGHRLDAAVSHPVSCIVHPASCITFFLTNGQDCAICLSSWRNTACFRFRSFSEGP